MHYFSFLVALFVAFGFARSQRKLMSFMPPEQINKTKAGVYNRQTQKCCLGNIHDSIKLGYQKCCGGNVYDISKQLCCEDAIFDMAPALGCCGNGTINTDQSICCDDQRVDVPQKDASLISYANCCGQSHYDTRTQTCCDTDSGMKVLDGANKVCCGEELYEKSKQVCCPPFKNDTVSFTVVPREGEKTSCCAGVPFDPYEEYCCDGKIVNVAGCCGSKVYNTSTHVCCNHQDLLEKNGKDVLCCGKEPYTSDTHICGYNATSSTLMLVTKTDSNQSSCCGMVPYDFQNQMCCYDTKKVIDIQHKGDNDCCGDASFNSRTQQCCGGKPIDIDSNICCGDVIYDPKTKICCTQYSDNGTMEAYDIADNLGFTVDCCGLKTYDPSTQKCCENTLVPLKRHSRCCGDQSYDFTTEICCSKTVFSKSSGQDSCCFHDTTDQEGYC